MRSRSAKFSRHQFNLIDTHCERRYALEIVEMDNVEPKFYLFDYYGWPISDWPLIRQAITKWWKYEKTQFNRRERQLKKQNKS